MEISINIITGTSSDDEIMFPQPHSVPPKISSSSPLGIFAFAVLAFVGIAGASVLFFFDPTKNNFYPVCQFHLLTGLYCPGCGATRACHQLLHGNFLVALHDNALFVVSLAALTVRGAWVLKRKICKQPTGFFIPPAALWLFLPVAVGFVVLRNLPAFSFLAP